MSEAEFKKVFDHLRFESVLQYVAFPQLDVGENSDSEDKEARVEFIQDPLVVFFKWLRHNNQGVKRIIRVVIDDFEDPEIRHKSHSDEGIEQALEGFVSSSVPPRS